MQLYDAVMTKLLSTPESIVEMFVVAKMKGILTGRLKCTKIFKWENCENIESEDLINLRDHDFEENEEHKQWLV